MKKKEAWLEEQNRKSKEFWDGVDQAKVDKVQRGIAEVGEMRRRGLSDDQIKQKLFQRSQAE